MANNTQFSIGIHLMAGLASGCDKQATSAHLAKSVNTSPSFIRRVLAKLSKSGLVNTTTGKNGSCALARKASDISLLDIYKAVEAPKAFAIHTYSPQKSCELSCNIKKALEKVLDKTQKSVDATLAKISLADVVSDLKKK